MKVDLTLNHNNGKCRRRKLGVTLKQRICYPCHGWVGGGGGGKILSFKSTSPIRLVIHRNYIHSRILYFNGSNTFRIMKICSRPGIFSIFFNMKVWSVFSLELPHRGDSNEYTQHTILN